MKRLSSIDCARGLVMLLMLLDHVREFFFYHAQVSDPVDLSTVTPGLFFSRFCAHLCAPVFVLLTGTSAWLYQNKTSKKAASEFLFKRGLILIFLEFTFIRWGWDFTLIPKMLFLQVIWAIGFSMIYLSVMLWLPRAMVFITSLIIICGHNLLDPISFQTNETGHLIWAILHDRSVFELWGQKIRTSYPILPWLGVISIGYVVGPWFAQSTGKLRAKWLSLSGVILLSLFFVVRLINQYGETRPWEAGSNLLWTVMSFLNLTKYPPSLDFLLLTLGAAAFVLRAFETESKTGNYLKVFGQVPMFFYIVHVYVVQVLYNILKLIFGPNHGDYFSVPNVAYLWLISILLAHPLWLICRWYGNKKRLNPHPLMKYI